MQVVASQLIFFKAQFHLRSKTSFRGKPDNLSCSFSKSSVKETFRSCGSEWFKKLCMGRLGNDVLLLALLLTKYYLFGVAQLSVRMKTRKL